jgi:hypothetical protein
MLENSMGCATLGFWRRVLLYRANNEHKMKSTNYEPSHYVIFSIPQLFGFCSYRFCAVTKQEHSLKNRVDVLSYSSMM